MYLYFKYSFLLQIIFCPNWGSLLLLLLFNDIDHFLHGTVVQVVLFIVLYSLSSGPLAAGLLILTCFQRFNTCLLTIV